MPHENAIVIERIFDAPRELVWQAWTDPQHLARWWGPRGFRTEVEAMELRVGARWKMTMIDEAGKRYPAEGVFTEIVPLEKIVSTDEFGSDDRDGVFVGIDLPQGLTIAAVFESVGEKTKLTLTVGHATPEDRAKHEKMGAVVGWGSTLDCMDDHLAHLAGTQMTQVANTFVASRTYDAPVELVWQAWTDPAAISRWWGPYGFSTTTHDMDFKPGGVWRFTMHGPDGRDYKNKVVYQVIEKHRRLAYKHADDGEVEPVCFEADIRFEAMGDKTRMKFQMVFPTEDDLQRVVRAYGADKGLRETTTRLSDLLATPA